MIEFLLLLLWGARSLRALLRSMTFWQVKEYRLDRARAHWQVRSAWREIFSLRVLLKIGLAAAFLFSGARAFPLAAGILVALIWGYESGRFARELAAGTFMRPRRTLRALGILVGGALFVAALLLAFLRISLPLPAAALIADLTLPLGVGFLTALSAIPVGVQRRRSFAAAARILRVRPKLTVVGITGSYGKTSTKEFLATFLASHVRVQATPEHVNTEIGIAHFIQRELRPDTEVFVCEMGAYREGEIARAAAIARPRIGILTAIGNQHLSLFGSQDAIVRAKGELLRALPQNGTAILNADNPLCEDALRGVTARTILRFGHASDADVRAENVEVGDHSLSLQVSLGGERASLTVPLLGHLHVPNLLAAIAAASALGCSFPEIETAARNIRPLPRTMEPVDRDDGTLVIDDSYSANPEGVLAALEYLLHAGRARRIVVLQPMIELGPAADAAHRAVGDRLGDLRPDLVIVTGTDSAHAIGDGLHARHPEDRGRLQVLTDPVRAAALVNAHAGPDTVVLLEGRVPDTLRQILRS